MTHKFGSREWFTILIHEFGPRDPREWPTSLTQEFDPQEWPTSLTHELDQRQWSMSLTHEIDPQDPRDPRDLAHLFGATVPSSLINIKLRTCPSASNRTLPVSKEYLVILSFIFFAYALKVNRQPNINFKNWWTRCLLFHYPSLKSQGFFIYFLKFLVLCNDKWNVFRGEAVSSRAKNNKVLVFFDSNTACDLEYEKTASEF